MGDDDERAREIAVDPAVLERLAERGSAWGPGDDPEVGGGPSAELRAEAVALLGVAIRTRLTPRQRELVELYFYAGKTQAEIAEILGIRQQVVSKQLFGAVRKGRKVGGAIRRLRALLEASGISFDDDTC